jgi:hypothetical protein
VVQKLPVAVYLACDEGDWLAASITCRVVMTPRFGSEKTRAIMRRTSRGAERQTSCTRRRGEDEAAGPTDHGAMNPYECRSAGERVHDHDG